MSLSEMWNFLRARAGVVVFRNWSGGVRWSSCQRQMTPLGSSFPAAHFHVRASGLRVVTSSTWTWMGGEADAAPCVMKMDRSTPVHCSIFPLRKLRCLLCTVMELADNTYTNPIDKTHTQRQRDPSDPSCLHVCTDTSIPDLAHSRTADTGCPSHTVHPSVSSSHIPQF